jgi:hypothetical protein
MKTKHKRLIIIGCGILLGPLLVIIALLAPGTSSLSMSNSKLLIPFYPIFWIAMWSLEISRYCEGAINFKPSSNMSAFLFIFGIQTIVFALLGVTVAFLKFPLNKKSLSNSTETKES